MRHLTMSMRTRRARRWLGSALLAGLALALAPTSAAAQAEAIEYYATDAVGSTRVVFAPDGTVKARSEYLPFGEALNATGSLPAQRFTGQERDGEAGLDNFNARQFDAGNGRFTRLDPAAGDPMLPQTWNRYAYGRNSPLGFNDPSGMTEQRVVGNVPSWVTSDMIFGGGHYSTGQYATRIGAPPGDLESRLNGITAGYHGGDLESAEAAWGVIVSRSSLDLLGSRVGVTHAGGVSLEEMADASLRLGAAVDLLNSNAASFNSLETAAIKAVKSLFVTNDEDAYIGTTGRGNVTLSSQLIRDVSTPWLASLFGHEGQHSLNTGRRFRGNNAWKDEYSASVTQLTIGMKIGLSSDSIDHLIRHMTNPRGLQEHMRNGFRYRGR